MSMLMRKLISDSLLSKLISVKVSLALLACVAGMASAQIPWPQKQPITFVVPYAPGGGADIVARLVAEKMGPLLGQTIVVQNRAGASGQIAAAYVASAPADGYTVLIDATAFLTNKFMSAKLRYDPETSFTPVGVIARFPLIAVVANNYEAKSLLDLIALAKAQPSKVSVASAGVGTVQDLAARMFMRRANVQMNVIPYKGGAQAMIDVISGQLPLLFGNGASAIGYVKAGTLRALAVTGHKRLPELPNVPTLEELGISGVDLYEWNGMYLSAGTPNEIVTKFSEALIKTLDPPDVSKRLTDLGGERLTGGSSGANEFIKQQSLILKKIIQEENIVMTQ